MWTRDKSKVLRTESQKPSATDAGSGLLWYIRRKRIHLDHVSMNTKPEAIRAMESQPSSSTEQLKVGFEFAQLMGELSDVQRKLILAELQRIQLQIAQAWNSIAVLIEVVGMENDNPYGG